MLTLVFKEDSMVPPLVDGQPCAPVLGPEAIVAFEDKYKHPALEDPPNEVFVAIMHIIYNIIDIQFMYIQKICMCVYVCKMPLLK
jgi:hypothetical protein